MHATQVSNQVVLNIQASGMDVVLAGQQPLNQEKQLQSTTIDLGFTTNFQIFADPGRNGTICLQDLKLSHGQASWLEVYVCPMPARSGRSVSSSCHQRVKQATLGGAVGVVAGISSQVEFRMFRCHLDECSAKVCLIFTL